MLIDNIFSFWAFENKIPALMNHDSYQVYNFVIANSDFYIINLISYYVIISFYFCLKYKHFTFIKCFLLDLYLHQYFKNI